MMFRDDRMQQPMHQGSGMMLGGGYYQREGNHIDHGMQGSRSGSEYPLNHADLIDRDRFDRRTSSIATIEQLEAHLDASDSTGSKATNRALATAAYIGLLTVIVSLGKSRSTWMVYY